MNEKCGIPWKVFPGSISKLSVDQFRKSQNASVSTSFMNTKQPYLTVFVHKSDTRFAQDIC